MSETIIWMRILIRFDGARISILRNLFKAIQSCKVAYSNVANIYPTPNSLAFNVSITIGLQKVLESYSTSTLGFLLLANQENKPFAVNHFHSNNYCAVFNDVERWGILKVGRVKTILKCWQQFRPWRAFDSANHRKWSIIEIFPVNNLWGVSVA